MKKLLLQISIALILFSCEQRMSTEQLTQEIKQNMIEHFAENSDDYVKAELVDLSIIHKGGNEYKGMVDLIIENPAADLLNNVFENDYIELKKNIEATYSVEILYDGESYSWEILFD